MIRCLHFTIATLCFVSIIVVESYPEESPVFGVQLTPLQIEPLDDDGKKVYTLGSQRVKASRFIWPNKISKNSLLNNTAFNTNNTNNITVVNTLGNVSLNNSANRKDDSVDEIKTNNSSKHNEALRRELDEDTTEAIFTQDLNKTNQNKFFATEKRTAKTNPNIANQEIKIKDNLVANHPVLNLHLAPDIKTDLLKILKLLENDRRRKRLKMSSNNGHFEPVMSNDTSLNQLMNDTSRQSTNKTEFNNTCLEGKLKFNSSLICQDNMNTSKLMNDNKVLDKTKLNDSTNSFIDETPIKVDRNNSSLEELTNLKSNTEFSGRPIPKPVQLSHNKSTPSLIPYEPLNLNSNDTSTNASHITVVPLPTVVNNVLMPHQKDKDTKGFVNDMVVSQTDNVILDESVINDGLSDQTTDAKDISIPDFTDFDDVHNTTVQPEYQLNAESSNADYYYYDYPYYDDNVEPYNYDTGISVRKCCGPSQYFNTDIIECVETNGSSAFRIAAEKLVDETLYNNIQIIPGTIKLCHLDQLPPIMKNVTSFETHQIIEEGLLYDKELGHHYDHLNYCLEMIGPSIMDLVLTSVICPKFNTSLHSTRKCCEHDQYFDLVTLECENRLDHMKDHNDLVSAFSRKNVELFVSTSRLTCNDGHQETVDIHDAYLNDGDQLCLYHDNLCYPTTKYCLEDLWQSGQNGLARKAVVCRQQIFHKCCDKDHVIIHDSSCAVETNYSTPLMNQLMHSLQPRIGFPEENGNICEYYPLPSDNDLGIQWWVDKTGNLIVQSKNHEKLVQRYCVEDVFNETETISVAYTCKQDLEGIIPIALKHNSNEKQIGKCCPIGEHLDSTSADCVPDQIGNTLYEDIVSNSDNSTKLIYIGYPNCDQNEYHKYFVENVVTFQDHAQFDNNYNLYVYRMDGQCVEKRTKASPNSFCVDNWVDYDFTNTDGKGNLSRIAVLMCIHGWEDLKQSHAEKYPLIAGFLIVSSIALLATVAALSSIRVRKGLVTVKKIHTLAGRILISYVMSCLVGFLSLAIGNIGNDILEQHTIACQGQAGIIMFSLLASFFWNTSICLESLLLTLNVGVSEAQRFIFHSLWAWGIPGIITAITLIIDANRDNLPCGTILPKIGDYYCFFSSADGHLLYFYFPISLTLAANIILLISAKMTRSAKLKRLEMGKQGSPAKKTTKGEKEASAGEGSSSQPTSGMRTHQTRNLWAESVRLVMWSGGTWFIEFIGFIISRYVAHHQENWYDYLWYIPAAANSLRGIGIFVILVLTPENRNRMKRAFTTFAGSHRFLSNYSRRNNTSTTVVNSTLNIAHRKGRTTKRNMSIISQTTSLSSTGRQSGRNDLKMTALPHSVPSISNGERKVSLGGTDTNNATKNKKLKNDPKRRHSLGSEDVEQQNHTKLFETKSLKETQLSVYSNVNNNNQPIEGDNSCKRKTSIVAPAKLARVNEEENDCSNNVSESTNLD